MRFKSIVLISIIIAIEYVNCETLNKQENEERLAECGKQKLEIAKENDVMTYNENYWFVEVKTENGSVETHSSSGFFISKKHILTSSQSILRDDLVWGFDGKKVNESFCNKTEILKVCNLPNEATERLRVILTEDCDQKASCYITPKAAILIDFPSRRGDFHALASILLIELEDNQENVQYPCLSDKNYAIEKEETVDAFGINHDNKKILEHHSVKIVELLRSEKDRWICTEKYNSHKDRGGPLVKTVDGKVTVIGLVANTGVIGEYNYKYFFDLGLYEEIICAASGVCAAEPFSTTTTSTRESTNAVTSEVTSQYTSSESSDTPMTTQRLTTNKRKPSKGPSIDEYAISDEDLRKKGKDNHFNLNKAKVKAAASLLNWTSLLFLLFMISF